jgi:selenide,water dikinase
VTGFGLLGHLLEMAEGSGVTAEIQYQLIPKLNGVENYIQEKVIPGSTQRNWSSYCEKVGFGNSVNEMEALSLLPDPQTNGGLLVSVDPAEGTKVSKLLEKNGLFSQPIGKMLKRNGKIIQVI